jgi:hypothetical protein
MVNTSDVVGSSSCPSKLCAVICAVIVLVLLLMCASVASAEDPSGSAQQTDWSGGPGASDPVDGWIGGFESADGVSWLAISGQIALSGRPLTSPIRYSIATGAVGPAGLSVGDLDKDGHTDLAAATIGGNEVVWLRNRGLHPEAWSYHVLDEFLLGASSVAIRDVDGNGFDDVVACGWDSGEVVVWRNFGWGDTWVRQVVATGFDDAHWVDTADVDRDGDVDLIGAAADPGIVAWWRNDGGDPPQWTMRTIDSAFGGARSAVPVDLDRDGRTDILATALADNEIAWYRNLPLEPVAWSKQVIAPAFSMAHHATAEDVDLDGDLDVVAAGYGAGRVTIWINNGGDPIQWSPRPLGSPFTGALVVGVADIDGDNRLDVAATSDRLNRVSWWRNSDDNPALWGEVVVVEDFPNAWPLAIADLDHNGLLDLAAGASGGTDIEWWALSDFQSTGALISSPLFIDSDVVGLVCALEAEVPAGTSVNVEYRLGPSLESMGAWMSIEPNDRIPVRIQGSGYLQYRVNLATVDAAVSPIIRAIRFDWYDSLPAPRRPNRRLAP